MATKFTSDEEEKVLLLAGVAMHAMINQSVLDATILTNLSFKIAESMVKVHSERLAKVTP